MAGCARVVIVEDMRETRMALATLLDLAPDIEVVGTAGDGVEASRVVTDTQPDVVVTDYNLGHGVSGTDLLDLLRQDCATAKFIVFSAYDAREVADAVLEHGACAFVPKRNLRQIVNSIRSVVEDIIEAQPAKPRTTPASSEYSD